MASRPYTCVKTDAASFCAAGSPAGAAKGMASTGAYVDDLSAAAAGSSLATWEMSCAVSAAVQAPGWLAAIWPSFSACVADTCGERCSCDGVQPCDTMRISAQAYATSRSHRGRRLKATHADCKAHPAT